MAVKTYDYSNLKTATDVQKALKDLDPGRQSDAKQTTFRVDKDQLQALRSQVDTLNLGGIKVGASHTRSMDDFFDYMTHTDIGTNEASSDLNAMAEEMGNAQDIALQQVTSAESDPQRVASATSSGITLGKDYGTNTKWLAEHATDPSTGKNYDVGKGGATKYAFDQLQQEISAGANPHTVGQAMARAYDAYNQDFNHGKQHSGTGDDFRFRAQQAISSAGNGNAAYNEGLQSAVKAWLPPA